MNRKQIISYFFILCSLRSITANTVTLLTPADTLIRPWYTGCFSFQYINYAQGGFDQKAFDFDGHLVNPLQIYSNDQNALAMISGFNQNSPEGQLLIELDATDDGTRGHVCLQADLEQRAAGAFESRWFFMPDLSLNFFLPFFSYRLHSISITDKTKSINTQDLRVQDLLIPNIELLAKEFGGLSLEPWKRIGVGDCTFYLEWFRDFQQDKPLLKWVRLNWRVGLSLPSGLDQNEDKIFAFPFGYDGSFSLPFGFGLDLTFACHLRAGFDVQLTHVFGKTKCRRIKIDRNQTEFLLLTKTRAYKDYGMTQRFNLYAQLFQLYKGLSLKLGYQFYKQGASELSIASNDFSNQIANTAQTLREWTLHHLVGHIEYDFGLTCFNQTQIHPQIALYADCPVNGKRSASNYAIGGILSLEF